MKLNEFLSADELSSDEIQDPGLGSKYQEGSKRLLNKDGSFNVVKQGIPGNLKAAYYKFEHFFIYFLIKLLKTEISLNLKYQKFCENDSDY